MIYSLMQHLLNSNRFLFCSFLMRLTLIVLGFCANLSLIDPISESSRHCFRFSVSLADISHNGAHRVAPI